MMILVINGCKPDTAIPADEVLDIRIKEDPKGINPILFNSAVARQIHQYIFTPMADFDPQSLELIPILIEEIPVATTSEGTETYPITFRKEAKWDDGTPITAKDYLFTLKLILHPESSAGFLRGNFNSLQSINLDLDDPKSLTVVHNEGYMYAKEMSVTLTVLPSHIYDPDNWMANFTLEEIRNEKFIEEFSEANPSFQSYMTEINGPKYQKEILEGCGPYRLASYEANRTFLLERKENYWAAESKIPHLMQGPKSLAIYIMPDDVTAINELKSGGLDIVSAISKDDFIGLQDNVQFRDLFQFYSPSLTRYYYLLLNNDDVVLQDPRVRNALAHLVNVPEIIETMERGMGIRVHSLVHPSKPYLNNELKVVDFSPEKASRILSDAGWSDSDGDGDLDKELNGVSTDLTLDMYVTQQELGRYVGLKLQEEAEKLGINIVMHTKPFRSIITENVVTKDFDITPFAASLTPLDDDFFQTWHSQNATVGGSNYSGFENIVADSLISAIRAEEDRSEKYELYHDLQAIIQEEMPVLFLYAPVETLVVSKKWNGSSMNKRPGYMANTFTPASQ